MLQGHRAQQRHNEHGRGTGGLAVGAVPMAREVCGDVQPEESIDEVLKSFQGAATNIERQAQRQGHECERETAQKRQVPLPGAKEPPDPWQEAFACLFLTRVSRRFAHCTASL